MPPFLCFGFLVPDLFRGLPVEPDMLLKLGDSCLKNLSVFLALCLVLVKSIVNPIVQTGMNNNDLGIGKSKSTS